MNRTGQRRNVCRYFAASGSCFYGEQCQFLHVTHPGPPVAGPVLKSHSAPNKLSGFPAHHHHTSYSAHHRHASNPPKHGGGGGGGALVYPSSQQRRHQPPLLHYQVKTSVSPSPPLPPPPSGKQGRSKNTPATAAAAAAAPRTQVEAGGTTYFYSSQQQPVFPSLFTAHTSSSPLASFFSPEELRAELLERQAACLSVPAAEGSSSLAELESYHSLCPLEQLDQARPSQGTFGYPSTCYRAINSKDGLYYCLRRLHGLRLTSGKAVSELEKWRKLQHANLVTLREMFTIKAFGDNSVVFVYDYHAAAESLRSKHLNQGKRASPLPEPMVWEYAVQLLCGVNHVHGAGLALRCLDASKVIICSKAAPHRLKINCAGIVDILTFDSAGPQPSAEMQQQEDLQALGQLLLCVTLQSSEATQHEHFHRSMDTLTSSYSPDLQNIVSYLLQSGGGGGEDTRLHSAAEALPLLGARLYSSLERSLLQRDALEAELGKEVQNGRLFRLLAKLATITERPEYAGDDQWAETGDRYLLKLFRDYMFHQVLPSGQPWVDLAHIVQTLNKLDAGCPDLLALHARDESAALVVSYSDLKGCLDTAFSDVLGPTPSS